MEKPNLSFAAGAQTPPAIAKPNNNEIALVNFANASKGVRPGITELKHVLAGYGPSRLLLAFLVVILSFTAQAQNVNLLTEIVRNFKADAEANGITVPDNILIGYSYTMGYDTLTGVTRDSAGVWTVKIAAFIEPELLESALYYSLGHAIALNVCPDDGSIIHMAVGKLTERRKRLLFQQIKQFQNLCNEQNKSLARSLP